MAYNNNINNGDRTNEITLGDNQPLDNNLKPIKVGGETSILEVSSPTPDKSIDGIFKIDGKLKAKDVFIQGDLKVFSDSDDQPQFVFQSKQGEQCFFKIQSVANNNAHLYLGNNQGDWILKRQSSTTSLQFNDGTNTPLILDGDNVEFTNLTDGSITIDSFVDEDNMSSNSATKIPTQQSVKAYVDNELAGLVDSAPAALDTLNELASALNDDASFSTTITNSLATKLNLSGGTLTGALTIHTATDAMLNFKASDDSWSYMQFLQNDGDRIAYIGTDSDQDRLIISANENGANEVQIDTTTVDINANVDISGDLKVNTDLDVTGHIGVGIASPLTPLHIYSTGGSTEGLRFQNAHDIFNMYFEGNDDNEKFILTYVGTGGAEIEVKADGDLLLNASNGDNVGIGTTSPSKKLDVNGNIGSNGDIFIPSGNALQLADVTDHTKIERSTGLQFYTNSTARLNILDSGNVGIGTTSPTEPLEVYSANSEAYHYPIVARNPYNSASNLNYGVGIKLKLDDASENKWAGIAYEADSAYGNSGDLRFYVDGHTNSTPRMTLQHEGNLGIGTESPSAELHIKTSTPTPSLLLESTGASANIMRFTTTDGTFTVGQDYDDNYSIANGANITSARVLTILKSNGNVGIGTTSPTTTLDVEGTVSYKHISLTADSDDLDVSGCTVVECTPSGTDRLGGLTGGVQGQILYILKVDSGFGRIIIEHNEGIAGSQNIYLSGSADVMLSGRYGMTLYCTGSEWIQVG